MVWYSSIFPHCIFSQFCSLSKIDFEIRAASVIRENVVVPGVKYMQMSSGYKNEIWTSHQIFKKGRGLNRTLTIEWGLWERGGEWVSFFEGGGCNFYIKNKLKSEIFNGKKVDKQKCFSLS